MISNTIPVKTYKIAHIENMVADGKTRKEIADFLGIKTESLSRLCNERDVYLPSDEQYQMQERRRVVADLTTRGYSRGEIASALGIKLDSLIRWAASNSITLPPNSIVKDSIKIGHVMVVNSIPLGIANDWQKEANSRNLGVIEFASRIMHNISKDNLYNALL